MDTMELECPSCRTKLEIDIAFAGGVCRCSTCGTLMTVPSDPRRERAERLTRPDRPDQPGGSAPAADSRPDAPPGVRAERPSRPDAPVQSSSRKPEAKQSKSVSTGRPAAPPAAAQTPIDAGVYTTASGREVRITAQTAIPTAIRRKAMRIGIITGFIVFMLAMTLMVLLGITMLSKPSGESRNAKQIAEDVRKAQGNYDPEVNPLLLKTPNVLGLKPADRVVVVLDTSSQSRRWLSMAGDALIAGLPATGQGAYQVILARDGASQAIPETLAPLTDTTLQQVKDEVFAARPFGSTSLTSALSMALAVKPAQIILITSQDMTPELTTALSTSLASLEKNAKVDVVYLGEEPGSLGDITSKHNGILVNLPVVRLSEWHQDWQSSQTQGN